MGEGRMSSGTVSTIFEWWRTWGGFPVLSWVRAARSYRLGGYEKAARLYERGLITHRFHPAAGCASVDLAYCYFKLGKVQRAEEMLRSISSQYPNLREAHLRLIKVLLWSGRVAEATWTARRAIRRFGADAELVAGFVFSVAEHGGPAYLMKEVRQFLSLVSEGEENSRLEVARALARIRGGSDRIVGKDKLARLVSVAPECFEGLVYYAETLLRDDGRVAFARQLLRRAQALQPNHPKVSLLMAETYLKSGPFYNPAFAVQLAQSAAQATEWKSPRALHVLAEAYYQSGNITTALLVAYRARSEGRGLLSEYREAQNLEQLIQNLTLAKESSSPSSSGNETV